MHARTVANAAPRPARTLASARTFAAAMRALADSHAKARSQTNGEDTAAKV
jgi:hypothetical protein